MQKHIAIEMHSTYPFGEAPEQNLDDFIYVVKRVPFSTAVQRHSFLKKAEMLKNLRCSPNMVALLDIQLTEDHLNFVYEYIPFGFSELLQRNCDAQLGQARRTLSEITQELQEQGVQTRIYEGNVGLDENRQLKCYVAMQELPDFSLAQNEQEHNCIHEQAHESDGNSPSEQDNYSIEHERSNYNTTKNEIDIKIRLQQLEREVVKRSGVSNYYSEKLQKSTKYYKMDDLLQKINGRLLQLNNRRRQTTPSRLSYNEQRFSIHESQMCQPWGKYNYDLTTNASHNSHDVANHPKLLIIREQLNEATRTINTESRINEPKCKNSQYQTLKTERRMMLERIITQIQKTNNVLNDFRSQRRWVEYDMND